jgi:hypothetical protein
MNLELRRFAGDETEDTFDGGYSSVHIEVYMVAAALAEIGTEMRTTHAPMLSARSLARFRVSGDEFSVPI